MHGSREGDISLSRVSELEWRVRWVFYVLILIALWDSSKKRSYQPSRRPTHQSLTIAIFCPHLRLFVSNYLLVSIDILIAKSKIEGPILAGRHENWTNLARYLKCCPRREKRNFFIFWCQMSRVSQLQANGCHIMVLIAGLYASIMFLNIVFTLFLCKFESFLVWGNLGVLVHCYRSTITVLILF